MLISALVLLGAFAWGGIPSAYLVARYAKGIDIRDYGSGNAGSSNVMSHVGRWPGFLLGVFDCLGKGALTVVVARHLLDQSVEVQAGACLAAIAAHNWSPYMRFTGGRGVATAIGGMLGFMMFWEMLVLAVVVGVIGRLIFHETGLWTLVAMVTLPLLAYAFDRGPEVVYMTIAIGGLLVLKRLTANWEPPLKGYPIAKVMACRVLLDRDVPGRALWTQRQPPSNLSR